MFLFLLYVFTLCEAHFLVTLAPWPMHDDTHQMLCALSEAKDVRCGANVYKCRVVNISHRLVPPVLYDVAEIVPSSGPSYSHILVRSSHTSSAESVSLNSLLRIDSLRMWAVRPTSEVQCGAKVYYYYHRNLLLTPFLEYGRATET